MLSINLDKTRVVLIGTSKFPNDATNLPELPGVRNNVEDLRILLIDKRIIGVPEDKIISILDEPHASIAANKLADEAKAAEDTLIVYYSGHGIVGRSGEVAGKLLLSMGATTLDNAEFNSLQFSVLRNAISGSNAKKKILIIDCCFSGRALNLMGSEKSFLDECIDISGTFVIASSPANAASIAPIGEKYTAFTGELIRILKDGVENTSQVITLETLYERILAELGRKNFPKPQKANFQNAGNIAIAFNRKYFTTVTKNTISLGDSNDPIVQSYLLSARQIIEEKFPSKWNAMDRRDVSIESCPSSEEHQEFATSCGLYVAFLGSFYGDIYEEINLSYLEYELQLAESSNTKIVVFILPTDSDSKITIDVKYLTKQALLMERQDEFRQYIQSKTSSFNIFSVSSLDDFDKTFFDYLTDFETNDKDQELSNEISPHNENFLSIQTHLNYDRQLVLSYSFDALDVGLVKDFLNKPRAKDDLRRASILRANQEEHLQHLGIFIGKAPVLGAFLCFAYQRFLSDKFAACSLHMVVYNHVTRGNSTASPEVVHDNLLNLFEIGMNFLSSHSAGLRRTGLIGTNERDDLEIPELALREALANAIIHRDYEHTDSKDQPTRIEVYPDRVEITSYGALMNGVSIETLNSSPEDINPKRRNHIIANIFRIMQKVELNASGVSRIHELTKRAKLLQPVIQTSDMPTVKVIFFRPENEDLERQKNMVSINNYHWQSGDIGSALLNPKYPSNLSEQERLRTNPLTPIPNNLPRSGVVKFVGRDRLLEQLHTQLQTKDRIAITAIAGMSGIGKTELALQYAINQVQQSQYPAGLCWLRAGDRKIATDILSFAQVQLGISIPEKLEIDEQVRFCWQHWPDGEVLVILDDVTDYQVIVPYLPPSDTRFKLLITTRLDLGSTVQKLAIEELDEDSSIALLESMAGAERVRSQLVDAQSLCKWVGYLPLALELLGRFLAQKLDWSIGRLLQALEEKRLDAKALVETENGMTGQLGVAAALELSWQELNESEQELACVLGMFAIAPIPWSLVESCQPEVKSDDLEDIRDNGLIARSLLKRIGDSNYQLHQIVKEYFRLKLEQRVDRGQAIKVIFWQVMVGIAQSIDSPPTIHQIEQVRESIAHLEEGVRSWIDSITNEDLLRPFLGLVWFYEGQGNGSLAEPWYIDCLKVTRERLGVEHPDVATSLNNLAEFYRSQGKYEEAEPLYLSSMNMYQRLLGDEHPLVATSLNNLALLYYSQGKYADAEPLYLSAMNMYKRLLGEEHPSVAMSLNNLAYLYESQGKYEEAEPLYRSALEMRQRLLGEEHPDVATSLNNLAQLYYSQGKYEVAEPLYLSAMKMYQRLLAVEHPLVATSLNNLALLYHAQGKYEEAEPLYHYALEMRQHLLGENHPDVAMSQWNLGALYQKQGRYMEAEALYRKALMIAEVKLGLDHPYTQGILSWLNSLAQPPVLPMLK
jgi:predicted HTH transcriptional regulator/tetratricopeptide (TPR) repeat protein